MNMILFVLFVPVLFALSTCGDFGKEVEEMLYSRSLELLGFNALYEPASEADYVPRENATAMQRVKLAPGLKAEYIARNIGFMADMFSFFPSENDYTHLVICIEGIRSETGNNPGVQRVEVATGKLDTIVFGMSRCDGIRTTPWGSILATEETDDGAAYEIFDPLTTTNQWIADRRSGAVVTEINGTEPSTTIYKRNALPIMAWEGLTILKSGVVYAGDELRPGTGTLDNDGGAIFKFVPTKPYIGSKVTPSTSPFVSGKNYAMTVSCREVEDYQYPQYGQGCQVGSATWVEVDAPYARRSADFRGATGYYRPEDLHLDPVYSGPGVRWCVANTGREAAINPGEVICVIDSEPLGDARWWDERSGLGYQSVDGESPINATVTRFIQGGERFNSLDNLAFNPKTGHLYVIEDHEYGEIYGCLPDGSDQDFTSDGCVPFLSVADPLAEPTGFEFDGTGLVAYFHIQHGECPDELKDFVSNPDNGCTDDLLKISGFKMPTSV